MRVLWPLGMDRRHYALQMVKWWAQRWIEMACDLLVIRLQRMVLFKWHLNQAWLTLNHQM